MRLRTADLVAIVDDNIIIGTVFNVSRILEERAIKEICDREYEYAEPYLYALNYLKECGDDYLVIVVYNADGSISINSLSMCSDTKCFSRKGEENETV